MRTPISHSTSDPVNAEPSLRQQEQLRRFLYPSLISTDDLPLLLPLSQSQERNLAWVRLDLDCQVLLCQILRIAVQPWYSKLTNDRQLYEEVTRVLTYGLDRVKNAMLQKNGNMTRLEHFLLFDMTTLLNLHYIEVRRAVAMSQYQGEHDGSRAAAVIFLASNPHPALSLTAQSQLQINEDYLDVILLAIFQGVLPADHLESHNETLIIIDVVKGMFRGQTRVHGSGAWVFVRAFLNYLEMQTTNTNEPSPLSMSKVTTRWYQRANLILGFNLVYAVFKMLFFYLAVFYLDLFTPLAEPKKRSKRRKEAEVDMSNGWNLNPVLDIVVEALLWRSRITTRFIEEWLRIGLAWGGSHLIERQVKENLIHWAQPERIREHIAKLHEILIDMPNRPLPEPIQEPSLDMQKQELDLFITKLLAQVQLYPPIALLLGHNDITQRQSIESALSPFLAPQFDSNCTSVVQVANARTLLAMLESFAILVHPVLAK